MSYGAPFYVTVPSVPTGPLYGHDRHQIHSGAQYNLDIEPIDPTLVYGIPPLPASSYSSYSQPHPQSGYPYAAAALPAAKPHRRGSQTLGWPYDAAQSPTRMRFHPQDTNVDFTSYVLPPAPAPADLPVPQRRGSRVHHVSAMGGSDHYYPHQHHHHHSSARADVRNSAPSKADRSAAVNGSSARSHRESSASTGKRAQDENRARSKAAGVHGPMNHTRVPQELHDSGAVNPRTLHPSIAFQLCGFPEPGVKICSVMATYTPRIMDKDDAVLKNVFEKYINIEIKWPGYAPARKRMFTCNSTITRQDLLISLARVVLDWAADVQKEGRHDPRYQEWTIGRVIDPENLFITELVHRGTSHWQIELWTPNEVL